MEANNHFNVMQLGQLENNIQNLSLQVSHVEYNHCNLETTMKDNFAAVNDNFVTLISLITQLFAAMTTPISQNRSTAGISPLPVNPHNFENMVINTSFTLMHIPLPTSYAHIRPNLTTIQTYTPPPPPPLSFTHPFYTLLTQLL